MKKVNNIVLPKLLKTSLTIFTLVPLFLSLPKNVYAVTCNNLPIAITIGPLIGPRPFGPQWYTDQFVCLEDIFDNILQITTGGVSLAFFVMLVLAGFKWLTSGGDPKALEQAKNRLFFSILGLGLFIGAWLILFFISEFFGVSNALLFFAIPHP